MRKHPFRFDQGKNRQAARAEYRERKEKGEKELSFCQGFRRSSGRNHSSGQMSSGFLALTTHCTATAGAVFIARVQRVVMAEV